MQIEHGDFGQTFALLKDGTRLRLGERNGRLEISAYDGRLAVLPTASNSVEVTSLPHFPLAGLEL